MNKGKKIVKIINDLSKKPFFKDLIVLSFLGLASILLAVLFLVTFFGIKPGEPLIQLRFNSFLGVTKVGPWIRVYNMFVVGVLVGTVNSFLSYLFYEKEKLAAIFILIATIFSEATLIIEAINIIRLVNM